MIMALTFITLWLNSADKLLFFFYFLIFPRKWALTFHAYCLMKYQVYFLGKIKYFKHFDFFFSEKVRIDLFLSEKIRFDISCESFANR